ncbi:MAG: molybdenum cofactor biosynthesis protein MoaE [Blastomonas sp.]|jgi:molybdopterin synthase catalytic subunit|uniref:Molybdopterin synthase catalytic subunit n=1 Tax=Blastomonas fulva TaxID=1550728 RepID=A0ABM6M9N6_9SPHN|nr:MULTISPECIES: molybdenum cofactor biosynthesis protein MoaE [Blastomonas]ASR52721.1 molybdenum cofactor biosynthesis protein MoaE [Blastomonas fulva]MCO5793386.1 molybdenum cofactor biosynthesis protein MoaE [Blastomonas sp.]MDK2757965.1 molybdenum cofactor biosynthesis protein MoaE [Blastomonas fulva]MDM7928072.1 molybdenum cofactor biosynthesis protein MoaE [Blastomonas fulva]MDM7964998.1 molybdenum cofactor biosynthesis protein MoaE [Blastomonas fulva]
MRCDIRILSEGFDPEAEVAAFRASLDASGAMVSFTGMVRPSGTDGAVSALCLQHYPGMTERGIAEAVQGAANRWPLEAVLVIHRVGEMAPRDPIVLVATASAHRRAAFEAADFLMDFLKSRALFWKSETGAAGRNWIEPRDDDYADAARWDAD